MHQSKQRYLEIGPGKKSIPGFETFNLGKKERTEGKSSDYEGDARKLPFSDNTFDIVYSSHCIEHIPWFQIEDTIIEWARVVKPEGRLEVWTVNSYKIAKALVELEETGIWTGPPIDEWSNPKILKLLKNDPYKWASGRIMSYARSGDYDSNLHRSVLTPKYMWSCLEKADLKNIRYMDNSEVRGKDHGWINMGICGIK